MGILICRQNLEEGEGREWPKMCFTF